MLSMSESELQDKLFLCIAEPEQSEDDSDIVIFTVLCLSEELCIQCTCTDGQLELYNKCSRSLSLQNCFILSLYTCHLTKTSVFLKLDLSL